jgi:hypothetical protein
LALVSWFFLLFARKDAETCLRQTGAKKSNREQLYLFWALGSCLPVGRQVSCLSLLASWLFVLASCFLPLFSFLLQKKICFPFLPKPSFIRMPLPL